jgi:hypothetical protein
MVQVKVREPSAEEFGPDGREVVEGSGCQKRGDA